jgi:hypothetical protein
MRNDLYLNALRAKFGYAITVHKAQGGEWDEVFLFLTNSVYAQAYDENYGSDKFHRWFYTAVTRAREKLYVNDCPTVERFANRHPKENALYWKKQKELKNAKSSALNPWFTGRIARILNNNDKGINGFIKASGMVQRVYFSIGIQNPDVSKIKNGAAVTFGLMPPKKDKGPKAIHIKIVNS